MDWLTAGATVLGGLLGSQGSEQSGPQLDPRLAKLYYGEDGNGGLLADAGAIYRHQMSQGGLNNIQRAGLQGNLDLYQSQFVQGGFDGLTGILNKYMTRNGGTPLQSYQFNKNIPTVNDTVFSIQQPLNTASTTATTNPTQNLQPGSGGQGFQTNGASGSSGNGSASAPGGQGINTTAIAAALKAMGYSDSIINQVMSPITSVLVGVAGKALADNQMDGMSAAGQKLGNVPDGMGTVSDEHGNVRTFSNPDTIATQDRQFFNIDPSINSNPGKGGGGYTGFGMHGMNNSAGFGGIGNMG